MYLFNCDSWPPILFFVQQGQTYSAGWIDIGVEQGGLKFTCNRKNIVGTTCVLLISLTH